MWLNICLHNRMKPIVKALLNIAVIAVVVFVHTLFFLHHPPEVQLAFLTPGVTLLGYSIIRDSYFKKPAASARWVRER
jgi:hypothetical protein